MSPTGLFDSIGNAVVATAVTAAAAIVAALLVHWAASAIVRYLAAGNPYFGAFAQKLLRPLRWLLPLLALQVAWLAAAPDFPGLAAWRHGTLLAIIAAATWLAANALYGVRDAILLRHPVDASDNLRARRILTQATVLMRTLTGLVILLGVSTALMTFPDVRQVGASLLASAGLAGLVIGFAAKPVLGNVIAGMQIALVQPIRLDDVVVIEGEWGRIEEITGAYVVVRIWDERRLVVPLQWFIEHPFQNWTRSSADIIGSVFLWADYRLPLDALRQELERLCRSAPEWDGRVCVLQLTDASERAMQVRALVSSSDSGRNWDLRCRVREGLIAFLQREHPEALPRLRAEMAAAASPRPDGDADAGRESSKLPG